MSKDTAESLDNLIGLALKEDIGPGDITTDSIIPEDRKGKAAIRAKEDGVICGLPVAEAVFRRLIKTSSGYQKRKTVIGYQRVISSPKPKALSGRS